MSDYLIKKLPEKIMEKLNALQNWVFDQNISNDQRTADITIHFAYPDIAPLLEFAPADRIKKINEIYISQLNQLLASGLIDQYELTGTIKRPKGITTHIPFNSLHQLKEMDIVYSISIQNISHAVSVPEVPAHSVKYYCVKMTVVIDIEGINTKMQSIEERMVVVKAISFDDAYKKIEKQKTDYVAPYLNTEGRLVRWRIDSLDDCFEIDLDNLDDFNSTEGVEVYSKLKSRKRKDGDVWDGKS